MASASSPPTPYRGSTDPPRKSAIATPSNGRCSVAYLTTTYRPLGENEPVETGWNPVNGATSCTRSPWLVLMRSAHEVHPSATVATRSSDAATNRPAPSTTRTSVPPAHSSTGGPAVDPGTSTIDLSSTATGRRPAGRPPSDTSSG